MRNAFSRFSFVLLILGFIASCSIKCIFIHTICVEMPIRPASWLGLETLVYEISWKDGEGIDRVAAVDEGDALLVSVKRGERQAILAIPRCGVREFLPAGALYPFDLDNMPREGIPSRNPDWMRLSFDSGYPSATARCIEAEGYDPWVYPLEKLRSIRETRGRDPWSLAPWKAARSFLEGSFRISAFPAATNSLVLPADMRWWPESPFCLLDSDGETRTARLSEGLHVFFGEEEKLIAQVSGGEIDVQRIALR